MCTVNITLSYSDSICSKTFWSSTSSVDLFAILQRLRLPCVPGYGGGSAWCLWSWDGWKVSRRDVGKAKAKVWSPSRSLGPRKLSRLAGVIRSNHFEPHSWCWKSKDLKTSKTVMGEKRKSQ